MNTHFENPQGASSPFVDPQMVDIYLTVNQKKLPSDTIMPLRSKLYALTEKQFFMLSSVQLKDPSTMLIVSIFLGSMGIDRFMLEDTGVGILKLLTGGCCGILTLIDWFNVQKETREWNFKELMRHL